MRQLLLLSSQAKFNLLTIDGGQGVQQIITLNPTSRSLPS